MALSHIHSGYTRLEQPVEAPNPVDAPNPGVQERKAGAPPGPETQRQQERPAIAEDQGTGGAPNGADKEEPTPDAKGGRGGKKTTLQTTMADANQIKTRYDKVNGELQTVAAQIQNGERG